MIEHHLKSHLDPNRKHRILSIDGGGIRGVIALEVLAKVERELRVQTQKKDLVLAEWFDFIGGTSTGAIIAAGLSVGMTVNELQGLYAEHGKRMFMKARMLDRVTRNRYCHRQLEGMLKETFGASTNLGSSRIKTLLMLVLRNATTDSPWPVTNNPNAKFNHRVQTGDENNLDIPLWQLVRASTAAPTFYMPEQIKIGPKTHTFVDGALTPYNNPAFMMFLKASLPEYRLNWRTTEEDLLLVSVGTGMQPGTSPQRKPREMHFLHSAVTVPAALIYSNIVEQDKMCRILGNCLEGDELDLEIGSLLGNRSPLEKKLFTYVRYNIDLSEGGLAGVGCEHLAHLPLNRLDAVELMAPMRDVGAALADAKVKWDHFEAHCPFSDLAATLSGKENAVPEEGL